MKVLFALWIAAAVLFAAPLGAQSHSARELSRRHPPEPSPTPIASPIATPTSSPRATPRAQHTDEAYWLVGGSWNCKTFGGSAFTRTYSRDQDASSINAETVVNFGGRTGTLTEVYRKHKEADKWEVSLAGGQLIVVGSPWSGPVWTFDGHDSEPGFDGRVKMTYRADGPETFTREFARLRSGKFVRYAGEQCVRKPS